jgi:hypothetical protein
MKIFVNITSWTRVGSAGAEHYYAKISEINDDRNIFVLAREGWIIPDVNGVTDAMELKKALTQQEADYLNRKDRTINLYHEGDESDRFDSIDQIKEAVKVKYPNTDIAFFNDREIINEERDIFEANPKAIKITGRKIRIQNFEGFSKEFINLTEGSIHDVIEMPDKYEGKELQEGVWVWGVTEPVLVLRREFEYI